MLSDDSILRRIPAALEPKQALFVDGIRHAVEIMELAYGRLKETLTNIALDPPTSADLRKVGPHAFLDAWAMVDAVDRFRMLYQQMPGIKFGPPVPGIEPLKTVTQPFRDLRNVADHLSQRADFVVARGGAALGTLTWLTYCQFAESAFAPIPSGNLELRCSKASLGNMPILAHCGIRMKRKADTVQALARLLTGVALLR